MDDETFRGQIIALQLNKMSRGMNGDEFAVYCLAHKHIWEGIPLSWWINRFEPKFKWIVKRAIKENLTARRQLIVNWLPIRRALYLSVNRDDPSYVRHLFDLQPQRN
jgi:hypothetical protein